jgi:redox-sensitive bicupin YhaK (pirin superfamily)
MIRRNFILKSTLALGQLFIIRKAFGGQTFKTIKMNKTVAKKSDLKFKQAFPGLKGVDIMARSYPIEPFLVFTEFLMDKPVFGPHPHAGISVMTYLLPDSKESFINRDSQGDFSFIEPGGMHIMQAGSGMHHDEFPKITGNETHGFQIWINHADKNRFVTPKSMHAAANEVPEKVTPAYKVRVVHGQFEGIGPNYKMVTNVNLFHIFLNPNQSIVLDTMPMAFAYGLNGSGKTENENIAAQTLINYSLEGEKVIVKSLNEGLEFMFATGTPHNEPITYGGPFVMTTAEQMAATQQRYASGAMGVLDAYKG